MSGAHCSAEAHGEAKMNENGAFVARFAKSGGDLQNRPTFTKRLEKKNVASGLFRRHVFGFTTQWSIVMFEGKKAVVIISVIGVQKSLLPVVGRFCKSPRERFAKSFYKLHVDFSGGL